MPKICFIEHDGTRHEVEASAGQSVKDAALFHGVPGIVGYCGGYMMCGTCNGYVGAGWEQRLPAPSEEELSMLENVRCRQDNSRLTCQLVMTDELDGLTIALPEAQD